MKITAESLSQVRLALIEKTAALDAQKKVAAEAIAARDATGLELRGLQGAFDIAAAAYAGDAELSTAQLNSLPAAVQAILGYAPKAATPAKA